MHELSAHIKFYRLNFHVAHMHIYMLYCLTKIGPPQKWSPKVILAEILPKLVRLDQIW